MKLIPKVVKNESSILCQRSKTHICNCSECWPYYVYFIDDSGSSISVKLTQ